jgi:hypothetical protein
VLGLALLAEPTYSRVDYFWMLLSQNAATTTPAAKLSTSATVGGAAATVGGSANGTFGFANPIAIDANATVPASGQKRKTSP